MMDTGGAAAARKSRPLTPHRVIRRYLLIAGLYTLSASLIWAINTLFLLDAGLDIFGVFVANAAYTAGMVLFEIPTGVVADTLGRRASFLLSVAVLSMATLGYVGAASVGGGVLLFSVMSVFLGLGYCFYTGAVEAWLVDALNATGFDGVLGRVFALGQIATGTAMLAGTVGGGLLGTVDLAVPYVVRAALLIALFGVAFAIMHDVGFTPRPLVPSALPSEMRYAARAGISYGWRSRQVRLLMGVSFLQYGFLAWGFYAWQPYVLELLGRQAVWVAGVVSAMMALSSIAGNSLVEFFTRFCGRRTTLLLWASGIGSAAAVGVGLAPSFSWAVIFLVLWTASTGVVGPVKQAYLHLVIPSEQRATVVSFDSMIGDVGATIGQPGLGFLSRTRSIADSYVVGAVATALALPLLAVLRGLRQPADVIIGTAGRRAACAGQGLPNLSSIDSVPRGRGEKTKSEGPA